MIIIDGKILEVASGTTRRSALFLDRDGVINVDFGYVSRVENFVWVDGIFDLCRSATAAGQIVVVVTNQGGIGLGRHTEDEFRLLSRWMIDEFRKEHIEIARVIGCPHHPLAVIEQYRPPCPCRKPAPGMILRTLEDFSLDATRSIFVGDNTTDMEAAASAEIGTRVLVSQGDGPVKHLGTMAVSTITEARKLLYAEHEGDAGN